MLPLSNALAFSLAALVLIAIPGPSVLFVIGRSLALGRKGGLLSVLGNALGMLSQIAAVALGVGVIVADDIDETNRSATIIYSGSNKTTLGSALGAFPWARDFWNGFASATGIGAEVKQDFSWKERIVW